MEFSEIYEEYDETKEIHEVEETADTSDLEQPSFRELLNDPELFEHFAEGDYTYETNAYGKHAYGNLINETGERDVYAQQTLPGKPRGYDGSHLIANRYRGAGGYENLDAGTISLNRGAYKSIENEWGRKLDEGEKVYVDVQTYHTNGSPVPDAWMGYSISEGVDGKRQFETFSLTNASKAELEEWERIIEEIEEEDY